MDGATIEWEKHEQFEGLSAEEKGALTVKEYEELEQRRMEKNAWNISKQLVERTDGAPVLSERITAYLSESDKVFYFNQKYLLEYHSVSSQEAKKMVPGASYFAKLLGFFHSHYRVGEFLWSSLSLAVRMTTAISAALGAASQFREFLSLSPTL